MKRHPQRSESLWFIAGTAPAAPEPVCLKGFRAHFFDLRGTSVTNIAFQDPRGRLIVFASTGPRFEFAGHEIHDASEDLGPLFGGQVPSIGSMHGSWEDVGTIVIGEEGGGRNKFRTNFKPNAALSNQQVPEEIATRKAGWYFVRLYNLDDELIDSLNFRFAQGLRAITLQGINAVPSGTGHQVTAFEFHHDPDWCVAQSSANPGEVDVERAVDKTILTIPPAQNFDRTRWLFGLRGGPQVGVSILAERIWWATSDEKCPPKQWTDKQLEITREDLNASSTRALWLHFPKQRWTDSVLVGFSPAVARRYRVPVIEDAVAVPLRDFGDAPELNTVGKVSLHLFVNHQGTTHEGIVCTLTIMARCTFRDFSAATEDEVLQHIRAQHLHELTPVLTWEQYRQRMPSLPTVIYRCAHCPEYVRAENSLHPTNAIIRHITDNHENPMGGPVTVRFYVVKDTDEIRQNVIANLPRIHRCTLCGSELEDFDEADLWRHSVEKHKSRLLDHR